MSGEVTQLLVQWREGDEDALEKLIPIVYSELHRLARLHMQRERQGHVLETTALIHEAYLKLANLDQLELQDRRHFFAMSARLMRQVLVDFARSRETAKRGGDAVKLPLEEELISHPRSGNDVNLVALDQALEKLSEHDQRKVRVVELRFFAGLSVRETAETLSVSEATVMRDWRLARAWLKREL